MAKRVKDDPLELRADFIAAILSMKFGELLGIGEELAELKRHPGTATEFAKLLYDWADSES